MTMQMTAKGSSVIPISVTKALTASGNYAAEDVLSESETNGVGTAWTFANCGRVAGGKGRIVGAKVFCETTAAWANVPLTIYVFNATPTSELDDNAVNTAVIHADVSKHIGTIAPPAMNDLGGDSETIATPSTYGNLAIEYQCAAADTALYAILVTGAAVTGETAGDDMTIVLWVERY